MNFNNKHITLLKGDASFRKFYRKKNRRKTSIIIFANKEKAKNLLIYDAINNLLLKNNINAPRLYKHNYKKNYIEVEDLGKKTVFQKLKNKKIKKLKYYKKIIQVLLKIQKIKDKKIKNFNKNYYKVPLYSKKILLKETSIFFDWYVPSIFKKKKASYINRNLKKIIYLLLQKIKQSNDTFVHRDFHVSNIIINKNQVSLLDNQDALIGNKSYDLASLVDDVRIKTPKKLKDAVYNYFIKLNTNKINEKNFKDDFDILSVIRNMKIIGIFTRLAIRDKKKNYLKLIPHAWNLIIFRLKKNIIFKDLKYFLEINFPKKIRVRK